MNRPSRLLPLLALTLAAFSIAAAGRPLAPRPLVPTPYATLPPVSAYAGGRFLTVWREAMGTIGTPLMGAFSDASGQKISPRSFALDIPPVHDGVSYRLLGMGDSFTLFWRIEGSGVTNMVDVDLEGRVTNRRTVALPDYIDSAFAWNGTHFLAVMQSPGFYTAAVALFDRAGRIVVPPAPVPGRTETFDIVVAGERFIAVTSSAQSVIAQEVTAAGVTEATIIDYGPGSPYVGYSVRRAVATPLDNGDVLVVWAATILDKGLLKAAVVRPDGTRPAQSTLFTNGLVDIAPLEVLRTGDEYLVAFVSGGAVYRVRLDASAAPLGDPEVVLQTNGQPARHAAASPGTILIPYAEGGFPIVRTVAIGADGQTRTDDLLSIGYARQLQPILGTGSGNVFAAWTELANGVATLCGTTVDADGEPREPVRIAQSELAATETAFNGIHHLVLHHDATKLMATRVTADGMVAALPLVLTEGLDDGGTEAAVVWTGDRWIVVWTDHRYLLSVTISASGVMSNMRTLDVHAPLPPGESRLVKRPVLAFDGSRVLLTWWEFVGGCLILCVSEEPPKIYATRLTRTGAPSDLQPVDLELPGTPKLSVATSGSEFLVVAGSKLRVLDGGSQLRVMVARDLMDWPALSDVTWDGTSYVVALRYSAVQSYLRVLRLDRAANDAAVRRGTTTLPPDEPAAPSIATPFAGNALIGVQEGTPADGASATVYLERDLAPLPAPPGTPRNVHVRRLSSTELEVAWDPPAEGEPDSYIVELTFDFWQTRVHVPGGTRQVRVTWYYGDPVVRVRAFNVAGPSGPAPEGSGKTKRRAVR